MKTNVMRLLDAKKIPYVGHEYEQDPSMTGAEIASILGEEASSVFKTLVTVGASKQHYVFVIPVEAELDLKKAAKAAGEKAISMIKQKEMLPLTGYVHGGCSPIGMKKQFRTFIDASAENCSTIFFSAGKIGAQVAVSPHDLVKLIRAEFAELC